MFKILFHCYMIVSYCYLLESYQDKEVGSMALNLIILLVYGMYVGTVLNKSKSGSDE